MQVITTHTSCDFDALASMVAAGKLYPEAKSFFPGPPSREVRDFLHLYGGMVPVEKGLEEEDLKKVRKLILVDTRWADRIGIFGRLVDKKGVSIHIYDHHPSHPQDIRGAKEVTAQVGATTSLLVDLIKNKGISLTPFEATLFTLGIYEDTGSLSFFSTTSLDLRSAAYLLEKGARLEFMFNFINPQLTEKQDALLKQFLQEAKASYINGVEVITVKGQVEEFVGGLSLPVHKFIDLKSPDVTFALVKSKDKVFVMARSRLPVVNVDKILSKIGGGGHNLAASAVLEEVSLEKVEKKIFRLLEKNIYSPLQVGRAMRSCVRFAFPEMKAGEVKKIMEKEDLQVLPVQEKNKIVGAISRQKVEHIIKHNSPDAPIKSYYSRKFTPVPPSFSLKKAQRVMIEQELPWLLVFEGDSFLGVVTSFDIFKAFHHKHSPDNLRSLMDQRMPSSVIETLVKAGDIAHRMGFSAFIVGGVVRDLLLGNENLDIDLTVEGDGISFARKLAKSLKANLRSHPQFGTARLDITEEFKLDIATSRRESYPRPGALPVVQKATLKEDLFRRDFTVNTMAVNITPPHFGKLVDFFGGKEDLNYFRVKVLHPKSFMDDPTRILRAVRFEQRYGFTIERGTEKLIKQALEEGVFVCVSGERIKAELVQILEEDRPRSMISRMDELGILRSLHPKLKMVKSKDRVLDRLIDAIARYEVLKGRKTNRWLIRMVPLLEGLDEDEVRDFCHRYSFTRQERNALFSARVAPREIIARLRAPRMRASSIYYLLHSHPPEALIVAMAKADSSLVKRRIILHLSHLEKVRVQVTGKDLKKMNYKPSPRFSRILEEVKKAKLNGLVRTKQEEIEFIKKNF